MKLTKGTILKARGGWDAEVVWIGQLNVDMVGGGRVPLVTSQPFWAVHQPGTDEETVPIRHGKTSYVEQGISSKRLPAFHGHPADLDMGEYEL